MNVFEATRLIYFLIDNSPLKAGGNGIAFSIFYYKNLPGLLRENTTMFFEKDAWSGSVVEYMKESMTIQSNLESQRNSKALCLQNIQRECQFNGVIKLY